MGAKKKPAKKSKPAKPKLVPIPFPLSFDEPAVPIKEVPAEVLAAPVRQDYEVACKVTSIGTRFWGGMVFVALEATDGQDLLNLLRKDQEVVLHYERV